MNPSTKIEAGPLTNNSQQGKRQQQASTTIKRVETNETFCQNLIFYVQAWTKKETER